MGTLPLWWHSEDGRVGSPLIEEKEWHRHLNLKFSGIDIIVRDTEISNSHCASMMITTKPPPNKPFPFTRAVLLEAANPSSPSQQFSDNLRNILQKMGIEAENVSLEQAASIDAEGNAFISGKAVVSLLEIEQPMVYDLQEIDFKRLHTILLRSLGGLWVSRGGLEIDPSGDPRFCATSGLLRTIRTEKPEIRMNELNLSSGSSVSRSQIAQLVGKVFKTEFEAEFLQAETEVSERDERLFIPRLYDDKPKNNSLHMRGRKPQPELQPFVQPGRPLRLDVGVPGMLDSLRFVDDPRPFVPLGDHEVEFEVGASAVNFMSVITRP